jgi:hypothetical protein
MACKTCPAGAQCSAPGTMVPQQCPQGMWSVPGTDCSECPPGFACAARDSTPVPCKNGTYATGNATVCTACLAGFRCPFTTSDVHVKPLPSRWTQICVVLRKLWHCGANRNVICDGLNPQHGAFSASADDLPTRKLLAAWGSALLRLSAGPRMPRHYQRREHLLGGHLLNGFADRLHRLPTGLLVPGPHCRAAALP